MIVIDLVPREAHLHWSVIIFIVRVELAVISLKPTDDRDRIELACQAAHPVDRPLPSLQVEGSQCEARALPGRHVELVHGGDSTEVERHAKSCGKLFPVRAAHATRLQSSLPGKPTA